MISLNYNERGDTTDDGKDFSYIYDALDRLVGITDQADQLVAEFRYNGLGHRIGPKPSSTPMDRRTMKGVYAACTTTRGNSSPSRYSGDQTAIPRSSSSSTPPEPTGHLWD